LVLLGFLPVLQPLAQVSTLVRFPSASRAARPQAVSHRHCSASFLGLGQLFLPPSLTTGTPSKFFFSLSVFLTAAAPGCAPRESELCSESRAPGSSSHEACAFDFDEHVRSREECTALLAAPVSGLDLDASSRFSFNRSFSIFIRPQRARHSGAPRFSDLLGFFASSLR
jgi:hypothetical protein